jgi:hypothetical protein
MHDSPRREIYLSDHPIAGRDKSEFSSIVSHHFRFSHIEECVSPSQFDEIDAKLHRRLEVTYPKVRASRAKPRTPTPQRRGAPRYGGSESRTLDAW